MVDIRPTCGNDDQRELGLGEINFAPMFAAAKNRVKYYLSERDPVALGGPDELQPVHQHGQQRGGAARATPRRAATPPRRRSRRWRPARPRPPTVPVVVTNDGDAPLTITAVALAANADDGGNATRDDFAIVSHNCSAAAGRGPAARAGQRRLQADAHELHVGRAPAVHVELGRRDGPRAARREEHGRRDRHRGRQRPGHAGAQHPDAARQLRHVPPTVTRNYETAMAATVTSTAGNAMLSVTDPSTTFPGHLVNGAFALPPPLNVRAVNTSNPTQAFAPLAEATGTATNAAHLHRPGQRRSRHARLPPGDRRHRRAARRQLQQDAHVHAVDHGAVGVPRCGRGFALAAPMGRR